MKKLMVLFALLLLVSSAYAVDLNACKGEGDFNAIGNCILRGSFSGDGLFFSMIMLALFCVFMWQARVPAGAAIGIGMIIFLAFGPFMGNIYITLMNLAILAIGTLVGLAILHFVRR